MVKCKVGDCTRAAVFVLTYMNIRGCIVQQLFLCAEHAREIYKENQEWVMHGKRPVRVYKDELSIDSDF